MATEESVEKSRQSDNPWTSQAYGHTQSQRKLNPENPGSSRRFPQSRTLKVGDGGLIKKSDQVNDWSVTGPAEQVHEQVMSNLLQSGTLTETVK